jgi:hypothetical protein
MGLGRFKESAPVQHLFARFVIIAVSLSFTGQARPRRFKRRARPQ